jgi:hypothetical protein
MIKFLDFKKNSFFRATGFFNVADTLESSSILIYSEFWMGLYTQIRWREETLIKTVIKRCVNESGIKKGSAG